MTPGAPSTRGPSGSPMAGRVIFWLRAARALCALRTADDRQTVAVGGGARLPVSWGSRRRQVSPPCNNSDKTPVPRARWQSRTREIRAFRPVSRIRLYVRDNRKRRAWLGVTARLVVPESRLGRGAARVLAVRALHVESDSNSIISRTRDHHRIAEAENHTSPSLQSMRQRPGVLQSVYSGRHPPSPRSRRR